VGARAGLGLGALTCIAVAALGAAVMLRARGGAGGTVAHDAGPTTGAAAR
jgi:hypothetical protein